MDILNHIDLECLLPTCQGLLINRHKTALKLCSEALSNGEQGSFLVAMDACCRKKLQEQGIEVPENISRIIPEWAFTNGPGPSAQHQSCPDTVFAHPIQGRATHLHPEIEISTLWNSNIAQTLTPYPAYKKQLPSLLAPFPDSAPVASETQTALSIMNATSLLWLSRA
eukprot:1151459-Pelagomonas_calceolata.AAC.2